MDLVGNQEHSTKQKNCTVDHQKQVLAGTNWHTLAHTYTHFHTMKKTQSDPNNLTITTPSRPNNFLVV